MEAVVDLERYDGARERRRGTGQKSRCETRLRSPQMGWGSCDGIMRTPRILA